MSCCKPIATWTKGGNIFVLIQVGETPNADCPFPFLLMSDSEAVDPTEVSCQEAVSLLIERHEKRLPTEFESEVEKALDSIALNHWEVPSFRPLDSRTRQKEARQPERFRL